MTYIVSQRENTTRDKHMFRFCNVLHAARMTPYLFCPPLLTSRIPLGDARPLVILNGFDPPVE